MLYLLADCFLYYILWVYFDRVMPDLYGKRLPWLQPFQNSRRTASNIAVEKKKGLIHQERRTDAVVKADKLSRHNEGVAAFDDHTHEIIEM